MVMMKFIFTLIVGVLLISHAYGIRNGFVESTGFVPVIGKLVCIGTCKDHPNCVQDCKAKNYSTGVCPPSAIAGTQKCCCVKTNHPSFL
ncbi:hypothetical protein Lalb_Chr13g0290511 [Lupinus albus]|uniref:Knottin, scorpion toxin n=1 Tax=Lupinus albus TaxID=3870 RepID=A0A6A4PGW7_LUPAL|nr:hypothetical protein Lalb_Chr13g0290511 [Lupinus albus]